jgi:hypothetical protein
MSSTVVVGSLSGTGSTASATAATDNTAPAAASGPCVQAVGPISRKRKGKYMIADNIKEVAKKEIAKWLEDNHLTVDYKVEASWFGVKPMKENTRMRYETDLRGNITITLSFRATYLTQGFIMSGIFRDTFW